MSCVCGHEWNFHLRYQPGVPWKGCVKMDCPCEYYEPQYCTLHNPPSMFADGPAGVVAVPATSVRSSGRQSGWLSRTWRRLRRG